MRIGFHTFGCKLNQFETEALAYRFHREGFQVAAAREEAEIYIVNTCTVTARADHKARAMIRGIAARHPAAPIVVTGCAAQLDPDALGALAPNVIVVPQSRKFKLLDLPSYVNLKAAGDGDDFSHVLDPCLYRRFLGEGGASGADLFRFEAPRQSFHTRGFLKVQDGCDFRCAYCRVPLARGPSKSLDLREVLRRAGELERLGFREIVLTGVNLSSYRSGDSRLPGLLEAVLGATQRSRLRLSSLEPQAVTEELADILADPRICPHFHIPVQSGSDRELARMGRGYVSLGIIGAVEILRRVKDNPFLAADAIVGFPGQTEEEFRSTRDLLRILGFSALHVFPFSPRPGTAAALMTDRIPERVRDRRAAELGELSRTLSRKYGENWLGRDVEVLMESGSRGVSSNYLKVKVDDIPDGLNGLGRVILARIKQVGESCVGGFMNCIY
jgi:threonylcarbamoyladenosine tRNA methylthiotransferase MtaB